MKPAATSLFVVLLSTTTLSAQNLTLPELLSTLEQQGFNEVEVSREPGRLKIEAEGPGMSRELVYDTQTGQILVDETSFGEDDEDVPGSHDDDGDDDDHGGRGDDDDDDRDDDDSGGGDDDSGHDRDED